MQKLPLLGLASLVSLAVACGGSDGAGGTNGPAAAPPAADPSLGGQATSVDLSGKYELSTRYDLTTAGVLPDIASQTLKALSDLESNPSKTILDLLEAAKVPIVANLLDAIPDEVKAPFEGWFNDHVFKALFQDVPVTEQIAQLISDIAAIATKFEVVSALDLAPTSDVGATTASHTLTGIGFTILSQRTVIDLPQNLGTLTRADGVPSTAVHIVERSPAVENGRLAVGDHGFGFPLGDFVLLGVDKLAQAKLGASNLRDALGKVIDCAGIANDVAGECIGPVCVGHESDIEATCNAGLDLVAAQVQDGLKALNFDVLHLAEGDADMFDAPAPGGATDGKIDRIDNGIWKAAFRVTAKGEQPITALFSGKRVGDVAGAPPTATK
jgi:hypothetical protein